MEEKTTLVIDLMICQRCQRISEREGSWREFDESKDTRDGYVIDLCPECREKETISVKRDQSRRWKGECL
jgi:hypothetical protein